MGTPITLDPPFKSKAKNFHIESTVFVHEVIMSRVVMDDEGNCITAILKNFPLDRVVLWEGNLAEDRIATGVGRGPCEQRLKEVLSEQSL